MSADRLAACFARCNEEGRSALIGYLTAGDPNPEISGKALCALAEYVDIIEIGMPFSDPMADGPVIQAASERALAAGTHVDDVFRLTAQVRTARPEIGIVLMGYANVPYAMGFEHFAARAAEAGADGVLIVDIPPEESAICDTALATHGLHNIRLLSPTSSDERIRLAVTHAGGFVYYVSLTGITGADMGRVEDIRRKLASIRQYTDLPVCVGFGVKTPEQARKVVEFADGVVIGSHFVMQVTENMADSSAIVKAVSRQAQSMREAVVKAVQGE
ncbi:MAG: tryptophan synthase subunit alpha [Mariprofundaceae bacterium]|nr:tryptophan synthase subunit alpha [Mariprofundaceae bacterium]